MERRMDMETSEMAIRRLSRERQTLRDKMEWFKQRNAFGLDEDARALMAEESAMLEAEMMRVNRDLTLAQGRFAERR